MVLPTKVLKRKSKQIYIIIGGGQNTDPQSMDYPNGLPKWTTQMDHPKMDYP